MIRPEDKGRGKGDKELHLLAGDRPFSARELVGLALMPLTTELAAVKLALSTFVVKLS